MRRLAVLLLALVIAVPLQAAQKIKLGTLAPRGSVYHQALLEAAEKWRAASDSGAKFLVYTDGSQGGEADMVRRMRLGQLNAAMITGIGLAEIDDAVSALQKIPMLFTSWAEVDYVLNGMHQVIEARLENRGFIVLAWADGGWVRFFSVKPGMHPDDYKHMRLFAWAGDTAQVKLMKDMGYAPVPLEVTDILPSLRTGLIDMVPSTALYALAGQIYQTAPYMLDLNWVPILGAIVITRDAWKEMSPAARDALKSGAIKAASDIQRKSREEEEDAIAAMVKRGLKVTKPTAEAAAAWQALAGSSRPRIRGALVPADMYDAVIQLVNEYRSGARGH